MENLFSNEFVYSESCMFAGSRSVKLLFDAAEVLKVVNQVEDKEYICGVDFNHVPGSNIITLTSGSGIPFVSAGELRPSGGKMSIENAVDGGYLLFDNCDYFARHQVEVSYRIDKVCGDFSLDTQPDRLPRTRKMLENPHETLKIQLHGDSISQGYNSTKFVNVPPYQARYIDLVCNTLPCRVSLFDHSLSGKGIRYPRLIESRWINDHPDLMVIAYGMNDFSQMNSRKFISELDWIIRRNSSVSPETEYLVVTPMTGNPQWKPTVPGPDQEFADAMRDYAANAPAGVAIADVQQIWKRILERKNFYDLTGNGVNHPNDYGHRVYASVIIGVLLQVNLWQMHQKPDCIR